MEYHNHKPVMQIVHVDINIGLSFELLVGQRIINVETLFHKSLMHLYICV